MRDFFLPRTFPILISLPSLFTWRIGLILASVPIMAVVLETRPPLYKWLRSSTVKLCTTLSLWLLTKFIISSMDFPDFFISTALYTIRPSPIEAANESTTTILASGCSSMTLQSSGLHAIVVGMSPLRIRSKNSFSGIMLSVP